MYTEDNGANIDTYTIVTDIIAAYVSNNRVPVAELPKLIAMIHTAVDSLSSKDTAPEPDAEKLTPAQIRKSITHDALVSFIDGKRYKTLKRHLTKHGLTPDAYRTQFGLPKDYPMVAPSYSEKRSALATSLGLGRKPGQSKSN